MHAGATEVGEYKREILDIISSLSVVWVQAYSMHGNHITVEMGKKPK